MVNTYPILVGSISTEPAYKIDTITLTPTPLYINKFADGNEQTIIYHSTPIGLKMQLSYHGLNSPETASLMQFYDANAREEFYFPTRFLNFTGVWQFAEPPRVTPIVSKISAGVFDVSVIVRKTRN
jgi:hypothetical protein